MFSFSVDSGIFSSGAAKKSGDTYAGVFISSLDASFILARLLRGLEDYASRIDSVSIGECYSFLAIHDTLILMLDSDVSGEMAKKLDKIEWARSIAISRIDNPADHQSIKSHKIDVRVADVADVADASAQGLPEPVKKSTFHSFEDAEKNTTVTKNDDDPLQAREETVDSSLSDALTDSSQEKQLKPQWG